MWWLFGKFFGNGGRGGVAPVFLETCCHDFYGWSSPLERVRGQNWERTEKCLDFLNFLDFSIEKKGQGQLSSIGANK